jgi:hypothetical protein
MARSASTGRKAQTVRLRNTWVEVDPRQWKTRNDMTINVGLGTGGKAQQFAQMMALANVQKEMLPAARPIWSAIRSYSTPRPNCPRSWATRTPTSSSTTRGERPADRPIAASARCAAANIVGKVRDHLTPW